MADLSLAFNPADIATASDAASNAISKITAGSAVWNLDASAAVSAVAARSAAWDAAASAASDAVSAASDAGSKATAAAAVASDAASKVSNALSKATAGSAAASNAQSQLTALDAIVVKSVPTTGSFAVHEILYTAAGTIKYVYSSVAAA